MYKRDTNNCQIIAPEGSTHNGSVYTRRNQVIKVVSMRITYNVNSHLIFDLTLMYFNVGFQSNPTQSRTENF